LSALEINDGTRKIFDAVTSLVLSVGGDGDGYIISRDYAILAAMFSDYGGDYWTMLTRETNIAFYDGQESIVFSSSMSDVSEYSDIVVKLDWMP